jgi:hypothetical protein
MNLSLLNELPRFSPWPARLLGQTEYKPRPRNSETLFREFETEYYLPLLEEIRAHPGADIRARVEERLADKEWLYLFEHDLKLGNFSRARSEIGARISDTLADHCEGTRAVVDLGTGGGFKVQAARARHPRLAALPLLGLDLSPSSLAILLHLARHDGQTNASGALFDVNDPGMCMAEVPTGALFFASHVLLCASAGIRPVLEWILAQAPRRVVHFEPCADLLGDDLFSLLVRRYLEVNQYDGSLHTHLAAMQSEGLLRIEHLSAHEFGLNPLLPATIVVWSPAHPSA